MLAPLLLPDDPRRLQPGRSARRSLLRGAADPRQHAAFMEQVYAGRHPAPLAPAAGSTSRRQPLAPDHSSPLPTPQPLQGSVGPSHCAEDEAAAAATLSPPPSGSSVGSGSPTQSSSSNSCGGGSGSGSGSAPGWATGGGSPQGAAGVRCRLWAEAGQEQLLAEASSKSSTAFVGAEAETAPGGGEAEEEG